MHVEHRKPQIALECPCRIAVLWRPFLSGRTSLPTSLPAFDWNQDGTFTPAAADSWSEEQLTSAATASSGVGFDNDNTVWIQNRGCHLGRDRRLRRVCRRGS